MNIVRALRTAGGTDWNTGNYTWTLETDDGSRYQAYMDFVGDWKVYTLWEGGEPGEPTDAETRDAVLDAINCA